MTTKETRPAVWPIGGAVALPGLCSRPAAGISALAAGAGFVFSARTMFVLVSGRWLNIGTETGVLAGFLALSMLLFAALVAGLGRYPHPLHLLLRERPIRWVLAYLALAGCSLLWSAAASPGTSALYWASLAADVAAVVLLFGAFPPLSAARGLLTGYIAGSVLLAAVALFMPATQDLRLGDPEYFNTSQIANLCALSILLVPLAAPRGSMLWRGISILLALTLLRSLSKSALVAFAAAQAYRLLRDPHMSRRAKWLTVGGAAVAIACFWTLLDSYLGAYTSTGNQAQTLTGRTAIWAWSLDAAFQHPWIGNGFDAMWKVAPPFGGELFEARHAENEILQQFFAFGVCGVGLLAGIYASLCRSARRIPRGSERVAVISIVIYAVVRGFVEAEPFDLLLPLWLVAALALSLRAQVQLPRHDGVPTSSGGSR